MKTIKVLLAEDEKDIREILTAYLNNEGFEVVTACNGQQAVALFRASAPQLVILDIKMPLMDGWQVLNEIRKTHDTPIMMLTALDTDVDKIHALRNGADDYIVKPFNPAEVSARVNVILRRIQFHSADKNTSVYSTKNIYINIENHQVKIKISGEDIGDKLTSTEFKILTHLIRYPKRVFTRQELLEHCLPENDANERTVDSHISKLRKKFWQAGLLNVPESIRGFGYRLGD
ncbi:MULTISPECIES: response regulator [Enterobacterales]|jgi:two-component system response regulator AdeR|uniref:DNA-binding response regulator n=9 Tax=Enterobacterales TaxID=91347 RepID=A0A443VHH6_RAOPL|nr:MULTISPECIES: response regulator [Enterobacterales]EAZ5201933.1 response regulator transcription factor [Salmonella enterica]EBU7988055.1 DNA-binding response regulator [Salmonella enterica subsp. enterica serovar Agona]ECZ9069172.1 response regulator transcription factor [Salmonella enterica subsp. enterica serovar Derby]QQD62681.1 response regulator transcription factor [Salmonella enterica subsp. enterica serovar Westhampton]HAS1738608.1 response regulator transcription factor [Enterobac